MSEIQLLLIVPKFKKRLKRSHKAVLIEEINSQVNAKSAHFKFV